MVASIKLTQANDQTDEQAAANAKRVADFITPFRGQYDQAMTEAIRTKEMCDTVRWNADYRKAKAKHTDTAENLAGQAKNIASVLRETGPGSDVVDCLKQLAKDTDAAGDAALHWKVTFVFPAMEVCSIVEAIKRKCLDKAREVEAEAPMFAHASFFGEIRDIVETWPNPNWNADAGIITIE